MIAIIKFDKTKPKEGPTGWIIGHCAEDAAKKAAAAGLVEVAVDLIAGEWDSMVGKHRLGSGHWIILY